MYFICKGGICKFKESYSRFYEKQLIAITGERSFCLNVLFNSVSESKGAAVTSETQKPI